MTFTLILTSGLITFGLAFCAALTSGPFGMFGAFRKDINASDASDWFKEGVSCPVCCSFWIGIPVAICLAPDVATGVQLWLTSLGLTCLVTSLSPD